MANARDGETTEERLFSLKLATTLYRVLPGRAPGPRRKVVTTLHLSVFINGDIFKFIQSFIQSCLIVIDDLAGTLNAFDATDGEGNRSRVGHIFIMVHMGVLEGRGNAGEIEAQELFLVI